MRLLSSFLALALSTSGALAADLAPLSSGKPAGVKHAQAENFGSPGYILLGVAALAGIAIAVSNHGNGAPASAPSGTLTPTTTG